MLQLPDVMKVQKTRPRTQDSWMSLQAVLKLFSAASPGGALWDYINTSSAASWSNNVAAVNTQGCTPIFSSHEVGLLDKG